MASATLKLFSSLSAYLPGDAEAHRTTIEIDPDSTVGGVIAAWRLPAKQVHLVLLNGHFVPPSERATTPLRDGDSLAIWPAVGGG